MTNRFLVSVAAIALIAGASAANAQGGMNREGGGGAAAQQSTPPSGGTGGATTQKSTEPSGAPSTKSTQSEQPKAPGAAKSTQSEPQKVPGAAKGQQAEDKAIGQKSKNMSTETETKPGAKDMKAEGREGHDKNMKAEGREGRDTNTNAQRTDERSQTTTGQAGAGAKLSTEQRTRITTVIRNERVTPLDTVDFRISVGTRVPRERISLRPLPAEVITIYPEWRGYEFFLVRDEIIVVDPRTHEIVAILPV